MNGSSRHWSHLEDGIIVNQVKYTPRSFAAKQINDTLTPKEFELPSYQA